jgi:hypothetical protein
MADSFFSTFITALGCSVNATMALIAFFGADFWVTGFLLGIFFVVAGFFTLVETFVAFAFDVTFFATVFLTAGFLTTAFLAVIFFTAFAEVTFVVFLVVFFLISFFVTAILASLI